MQAWILASLQGLVRLFSYWDSIVEWVLGPVGSDWRFGVVVPPTDFDAMSHTTALLWLYRNVSSELVWLSFVACMITVVCGTVMMLLLLGYLGLLWIRRPTTGDDFKGSPEGSRRRRLDSRCWVSPRAVRRATRLRSSRMPLDRDERRVLLQALQQALQDEEQEEPVISDITSVEMSRDVSTVEEVR